MTWVLLGVDVVILVVVVVNVVADLVVATGVVFFIT
jgi:hypothetical protein